LSNGSIDLTIGGGSPGYTYLWSSGSVIQDPTGLAAGTYSVVVTDLNGCTILTQITLVQPTALTEAVSAFVYPSGDNISCFGLSDGSIDLTIGGGSPGYTYLWSNGSTIQDPSGLAAGTYSVVATDLNGCTIPTQITLVQPTALTESISAFIYPSGDNISCFGLSNGSIDLTVGGGSPGYSYLWNNGSTIQDPSGLAAGTYSVVVTDLNGCTIPTQITLVQPAPLNEAIASPTFIGGNNISCFGASDGSINFLIGGGSPTYSYLWSNGAVTQNINGLVAGTYDVTVTDINGCQITSAITLTEPTPLEYTLQISSYAGGFNVTGCQNDGTIDLGVSGSIPGYSYVWSNGSSAQDINNLAAGVYTVAITDANGCLLIVDTNLVAAPLVNAVAAVVTNYNGQDISCFGASDGGITVLPSGGVPAYTYQWSVPRTTRRSQCQRRQSNGWRFWFIRWSNCHVYWPTKRNQYQNASVPQFRYAEP
jgi:uncharacterized protein affecting Mg2+/Co2+ transport